VSGQSTSFQYDGVDRIAEISAARTASILPGSTDEFFLRSDGAGTVIPLSDVLGSTIGLTDSSGNLVTSYTYEPYGATELSGVNNDNSTEYTGRENDGAGLYYYRFRYYAPQLGRFISQDPMGFAGGGPEPLRLRS
jgi:RHS repeat-associated protein